MQRTEKCCWQSLKLSSLVLGLYVVCNRIFSISIVLCLICNGSGVVRIFCYSGYLLCSLLNCFVRSVIGNSSL